jgi:uncharacterized protein (AIM24 family)
MSVIATDSTRFSAVVKYELEPQLSICRESIVINDTAQTLKVGAVLGKVTATGKYKLALSAAVDGSQTPVAVLIADGMGLSGDIVLANATDTNAIVLARGPSLVSSGNLQLGTGITAAAAKSALLAVGIIVETNV